MLTAIVIAGAVVWIACGAVGYGLQLAHFDGAFPDLLPTWHRRNRRFAATNIYLGPIGLFATIACGQCHHGFKWR